MTVMNGTYNFPSLYFETTRRCNLRCKICMSGSNVPEIVDESTKNELTYDEIVEYILKGGKDVGASQIGFSGGEFLLREDALDIVSAATTMDYEVSILTNGLLIDEDLLVKLKEIAGKRLVISFGMNSVCDSKISEETRDVDHGGVIEAIDLCKELGIRVHGVVNVGKFNVRDIDDTFQWLEKRRMTFNRSPFVPRNSGKEYFEEMRFSKEDMEKHIHPALRRHFNGYISYTPFFLPMSVHDEVSGGKVCNVTVPQNPSVGCWVGTWLGISAEGDVSPCATMIDTLVAGNLRERSMRDIVEQSEIFRTVLDRNKLKGKCGRCRYKLTCGGCRAMAYYCTGDYMEEDPTCFFEPEDESTVSEHEEETIANFKRYWQLAAVAKRLHEM